jgi:hypothetical protein
MKNYFWSFRYTILVLFTLVISRANFGQISYDFSIPLPPSQEAIQTVNENYFGTYSTEEGESVYEINTLGIWIISTVYNSISKETVRESSQYTVRDGFLFGVLKNDSIPCVLDNDRYYFGIKNKELMVGNQTNNKLKKINNNKYIINFIENDKFVPILIVFKGKTLTVHQFDYDSSTEIFNVFELFEHHKTEKMEYVTLTPNVKEWRKFDYEKLIFDEGKNYYLR